MRWNVCPWACLLALACWGCALDRAPLDEGDGVGDSDGDGDGDMPPGDPTVSSPPSDDTNFGNAGDPGASPGIMTTDGTAGSDKAMPTVDTTQPGDAGAPLGPEVDAGVLDEPQHTRFVGPCADNTDCGPDEGCVTSVSVSFCAQECTETADCEAAPDGTTPVCTMVGLGQDVGFCRLVCDFLVDEECPAGLMCEDTLPMFPAGTGTCGFPAP